MSPGERASDAFDSAAGPEPTRQAIALALTTALETMASAFVLLDRSATVVFMNEAAARALSVRAKDALGRSFWSVSEAVFDAAMQARCRDAVTQPTVVRFDTYSAAAGRWFEVSAHPALDKVALHWHDISRRKAAESALLDSEERVRMTAEAGLIGLYDWQVGTAGTHWSDQLYRILGLEPGTVSPSYGAWAAVVHPDDLERIETQLRGHRSSEPYHDVHRVVWRDGTIRTVETHAQVTHDATGTPVGMRGTLADITERANVEALLRESEARFRVMADDTPLGIWVTNERGQLMFANRRYCEFLGVTRNVVSDPDWSYLHPDDTAYATALATSVRTQTPFDARARVRRTDGTWRWIASRGVPRFAANGAFLGLVCSSTDITDYVEAEARERVHTVQAHFRSLFESAPGLMIALTPGDYEIIAVTDAYLDATHTTREALVGRRLFDAFEDDPANPSAEAYDNLRASLERVVAERRANVFAVHQFPMRRPDGTFEERWWSPASAPVLDPDGRVAYIVHRVEDVTAYVLASRVGGGRPPGLDGDRRLERMAAEVTMRGQELQRANEQLRRSEKLLQEEVAVRQRLEDVRGQLIAQLVSAQEDERRRVARELHDTLGQHLTGLALNLASLARRADMPSALARDIARLQQIAADIDDEVERLAAELRPLALDDLGLGEALRRHVDTWGRDAKVETDIHTRGVDDRLPEPIETTVYRVVQEALTNVRRHAGASRVSVVVEQRDGKVVAVIEDDGTGFDTATAALEPPGWHLGLSTMRERATLVGGRLDVESVIGKGTAVYLRVPVGG